MPREGDTVLLTGSILSLEADKHGADSEVRRAIRAQDMQGVERRLAGPLPDRSRNMTSEPATREK